MSLDSLDNNTKDDPNFMDQQPPNKEDLCRDLYRACYSPGRHKLYNMTDMLDLGVIPNDDKRLLGICINILQEQALFRQFEAGDDLAWKPVSEADASKIHKLTQEELVVFQLVERAGREGMWIRTMQKRSRLHKIILERCIKSLETQKLFKQLNYSSTKKLWILSSLQPLEEIAGGPFYSEGTIDNEFVRQLCYVIDNYIYGNSWHFQSHESEKRRPDLYPSETNGAMETKSKVRMPYPHSYNKYPDIYDISEAIRDMKIIREPLKDAEIQQLLDLLCWDGHIVKVSGGKKYRSVRTDPPCRPTSISITLDRSFANGLVESPCGRCPAFDICHGSGPVNARTCRYFDQWL